MCLGIRERKRKRLWWPFPLAMNSFSSLSSLAFVCPHRKAVKAFSTVRPYRFSFFFLIIVQTSERSFEQPFKETKLNYQNSSWGFYRLLSLLTNVITIFNVVERCCCWCCCLFTQNKRWTWWKVYFFKHQVRPAFDTTKFQQCHRQKPFTSKKKFQRLLYSFFTQNCDSNGIFLPHSLFFQLIAPESMSHYHHLVYSFFFLGAHKNIYSTQNFWWHRRKMEKSWASQHKTDLLWIKAFAYR